MRWFFKKPLHKSWLIAIFCLTTVVGVILSGYSDVFRIQSGWLMMSIMITVALWCVFDGRRYGLIAMIAIGLFFGISYGTSVQSELVKYNHYYGSTVLVSGKVMDDVSVDGGVVKILLSDVKIQGSSDEYIGNIWASVKTGELIKRGDLLVIYGDLQAGFGQYVAAMYRADLIDHELSQDTFDGVREGFSSLIRKAISEPEASLGIGYLVGQKTDLPNETLENLRIVGLTHVIVASGYNLTILVRLARRLFVKISKYLSLVFSLMITSSFILLAGMGPSMVRAGIVTLLSLLAWYYGRKFHPIILLSIVALVTLFYNPMYAWGDIGWQLSFAAFFGVMVLSPLIKSFLFGLEKISLPIEILIETSAAQIATLPIIIATFGVVSNVALIANCLVLPFVPLAMLLVFIAGVGAWILPGIALAIGWPAQILLGYMLWISDIFSKLNWATSEIKFDLSIELFCFGLIGVVCFVLWRVTGYDLRGKSLVE